MKNLICNNTYFFIFVDEEVYGESRDGLYERLKRHNIFGRRYFYPLISDFEMYRQLPSAAHANLPSAKRMAEQVICLPMYAELKKGDVDRIIGICLILK